MNSTMPMLTPAPGTDSKTVNSLNGMPTLTPKPSNGHDLPQIENTHPPNNDTDKGTPNTSNGNLELEKSVLAIPPVVNGIDGGSKASYGKNSVIEDITDDEMDISDSDDYDETEMNKSFDGNETLLVEDSFHNQVPVVPDIVQPVPAPPPLRSRPSRFSSFQSPSPLRPPPLARAPPNQIPNTPISSDMLASGKTYTEAKSLPTESSSGSLSFTIDNDKAHLPEKNIKIDIKMEPKAQAIPDFRKILECDYQCSKDLVRAGKDSRKMECDCRLPLDSDEPACGEDCLNRVMSIECSSKCKCGEKCTNRRFQKRQYKKLEVFSTDGKGHGLQAKELIRKDEFIIEYIGEVVTVKEFTKRSHEYSKNVSLYFIFIL